MGSGLLGLFGALEGNVNSTPAAAQLAAQGIDPVTLQLAGFNAAGANQNQALNQYQQMAAGGGPSAAQAQLNAGLQQSMAAQQALASGGRYGQNAALRQRQAVQAGAGLQSQAANQAAQLRAQEQQAGIAGSASLSSQMANQQLQAALGQGQLSQEYNKLGAGLYGQEQGQTAQAAANLQGSLFNGAGSLINQGFSGVGGGGGPASTGRAGMAHGGMAGRGQPTAIGEKGPELLLPEHGQAKLIDRPGVARLGQNGRDVVVPLERGSAPYHPGKVPNHETGRPQKPAPHQAKLLESAKKAMAGKGKVFSPGPGAKGLSPETAPIVAKALFDHGIKSDMPNARALLQHSRVQRALRHAAMGAVQMGNLNMGGNNAAY